MAETALLDPNLVAPDAEPDVAALLAARPHLSLHAMDGLLLEEVPLLEIARTLGTPCWVTGAGTLRNRYRQLRHALDAAGLAHQGRPPAIHYAVKANDHLAVLRVLAHEGAGADVVSGGELHRALQAGIAPDAIVFSGVGKTEAELRLALGEGVGQINVESAEELWRLSAVAESLGTQAKVALRVNPDVDAGTHAKITTGLADNKFGIAYADAAELYRHASRMPGILPIGLAVHIGSQILSPAPFRHAFARVAALVRGLRDSGLPVEVADCGGGLGIGYRDEPGGAPDAFAGAIRATLGDLGLRIAVEPGRWLSGPAGLLLSSVVLVKAMRAENGDDAPPFVVLDAAMNDLLRPSLYDSWHGIVPLSPRTARGPASPVHVVGPVCETGDTFARDRLLPRLAPGATVAILDTGAYGAVMSSTYNARPLAAQAMVDGARWTTIRPRQPVEALWRDELVPEWLAPNGSGRSTGDR